MMNRFCRVLAFLLTCGLGAAFAAEFRDCSLSVQFDAVDRAEIGCGELLLRARQAGAESVQLERCEFYLDGERRTEALKTLADEIRFFENAGYPVALWITSLGYGCMTDADFLRRFPDYQPLVGFGGKIDAVCSTDARWRAAAAENVRDFIRAGAKTILFDDDLVQACRPDVCCVCKEHLRQIAKRLGVASVTAEQVRDAYAGAPNPLRTAAIDVMGESLMDFCRAMRAAADEVDPNVMLATCLSISHYDLDGVDVPSMIRLLAGPRHADRPFVRLSGATYWVCHKRNPRNWGQGLGGVVEYLRWQSALLRRDGFVPLDENDPYPRDVGIVPEGLCEAYDRAVIAEGGIIRNKYVLRHNAKTGKGIDPEYFDAHMAGRDAAKRIAALFKDATPVGFEIWAPPHLVREATLPTPFAGMNDLLKFFAQPLAGILLAANGAPTRYDRDSGSPLAAFGPAAATLPKEWLKRGVLLDRDGARILRDRGVDTGLDAKEGVTTVDGWRLYANAQGEKFAVSEKGWFELDCRELTVTPVPVRKIWTFFTGEEISVCLEGAKGVHLLAKRRPDGALAVLVNNMRGEKSGRFELVQDGTRRTMELSAFGHFADCLSTRPIRIACIGDSITYGYHQTDRERTCYPRQLQDLLDERAPGRFEVRNFGNPGRGVYLDTMRGKEKRGFKWMKEHADALAWKPDIVISNLGINDVEEYPQEATGKREAGRFRREYEALLGDYRGSDRPPRLFIWTKLGPLAPPHKLCCDKAVQAMEADLARIAAETGAVPIDMLAPFGKGAADVLQKDGIHPTPAGAAIIAQATLKALESDGRLPFQNDKLGQ